MTKERKSFVLYFNFYNQIKLLSAEDQGRVFCAIFEYAMGKGEPRGLSPTAEIVFSFIRDMIDIDNEKYADICKKRSENGKKGGRPPKITEKTKSFFEETNKAYKDKDTEKDNEKDTEKDNDTGTVKDKENKTESGKTNCSAEKSSAVSDASHSSASVSDRSASVSHRLSEEDMDFLKAKGVEAEYARERTERAAEYAEKKGESLRSVLLSWWISDRGKGGRPKALRRYEREPPSFDTDDFFSAACERAMKEL